MLFTKNNKLWYERNENFLYIWLLQRIVLYPRRQKIVSLDTIAFLDTHAYIKNPNWQRKWNYSNFVQVLHSYLRYTDRLLDMFFLLLVVILSELHENSRRKDWVIEKSTQNNMCDKHHFFGCTLFLWSHFLLLFSSTPLLRGKENFLQKMVRGLGPPA